MYTAPFHFMLLTVALHLFIFLLDTDHKWREFGFHYVFPSERICEDKQSPTSPFPASAFMSVNLFELMSQYVVPNLHFPLILSDFTFRLVVFIMKHERNRIYCWQGTTGTNFIDWLSAWWSMDLWRNQPLLSPQMSLIT